MHTKHPKEDPLVELGYEHRDVNFKLVYRAIVYFFCFTIFAFGVGMLVFNQMHPQGNRQTMSSEMSARRMSPAPGTPLLQNNVTAKADLMEMRAREMERLNGTGYVDGSQTVVHIPVDRAIDLLLEHGMPVTSEEVPAVRGSKAAMTGSEETVPTTAPMTRAASPLMKAQDPKAAGTAITKTDPKAAGTAITKIEPKPTGTPSRETVPPSPTKKPGQP